MLVENASVSPLSTYVNTRGWHTHKSEKRAKIALRPPIDFEAKAPLAQGFNFGEAFCSREISECAESGADNRDSSTMSSAVTSLPYSRLLASPSGRSVEPSRDMPAN